MLPDNGRDLDVVCQSKNTQTSQTDEERYDAVRDTSRVEKGR